MWWRYCDAAVHVYVGLYCVLHLPRRTVVVRVPASSIALKLEFFGAIVYIYMMYLAASSPCGMLPVINHAHVRYKHRIA